MGHCVCSWMDVQRSDLIFSIILREELNEEPCLRESVRPEKDKEHWRVRSGTSPVESHTFRAQEVGPGSQVQDTEQWSQKRDVER